MDIRKTRTCEKCKAVVPLDKVRLVPRDAENNLLVCVDCSEEVRKISTKSMVLPSNVGQLPPANKTKYTCVRCNYKFNVDTAKAGLLYNLHCPYCGKTDKLQKIKKA